MIEIIQAMLLILLYSLWAITFLQLGAKLNQLRPLFSYKGWSRWIISLHQRPHQLPFRLREHDPAGEAVQQRRHVLALGVRHYRSQVARNLFDTADLINVALFFVLWSIL